MSTLMTEGEPDLRSEPAREAEYVDRVFELMAASGAAGRWAEKLYRCDNPRTQQQFAMALARETAALRALWKALRRP